MNSAELLEAPGTADDVVYACPVVTSLIAMVKTPCEYWTPATITSPGLTVIELIVIDGCG